MFSKMFSLFSRRANTNATKPSTLMQKTCQHDLISNMIHLPNGLMLSGGEVKANNNKVNLELYDPIKKTKIASRQLESQGFPRFLCMSNEWTLIRCEDSGYQYVVNSSTLESDKKLEAELNKQKLHFYDGAYVEAQQFATLCHLDSTSDPTNLADRDKYVVMMHDLSTLKFNQPASNILTLPKDASSAGTGQMANFKSLSNGLFACQVVGHNTSCFQILVFKREQKEPGSPIQFTHINTLHPKTETSSQSRASGHFISLSDGKILTYHASGKHFQVWQADGDGRQCVDEWSWHEKGVTCNDPIFERGFWTDKIVSLPDGKHLLFQVQNEKLFLFNMETRVVKPVELDRPELRPWDIELGENGQVGVRMTYDRFRDTRLVCIDFQEMIAYRQAVKDQLDTTGMCRDVNKLITDYSDTSPSLRRP